MKSKFVFLVVVAVFMVGCGGTRIDITSEPPGADIYAGQRPGHLGKAWKTPCEVTGGGYFASFYYQFKKDGYEDTEIFRFPGGIGVHAIHATLQRHKS